MSKLVIVESPAKAKTIQKYLGKGYVVKASKGHVVDLPKSGLSVDVDDDFAPTYQVTKPSVVKQLKQAFKSADTLVLAVDPDREGEAIGWHVAQELGVINSNGKPKKGKKIERIVFTEITESAVKQAASNPREIDMDLINAQQARRILDRLVGYKLSPLLWKKIRYGLSAGRVQSVAVKLIVDREAERDAFKPDEYWKLKSEVVEKKVDPEIEIVTKESKLEQDEDEKSKKDEDQLLFELLRKSGKKFSASSEKDIESIVNTLKSSQWKIKSVTTKESKKNPPSPFSTSALQQTASGRLGFAARRTMQAAQKLYEAGHITYMRTDSLSISAQAVSAMRKYLQKSLGSEYVPEKAKTYKTKSKVAQEAHESIRPTVFNKTGKDLALEGDQLRLYDLIRTRALATQMNPALLEVDTVVIEAGDYELQLTGRRVMFDGYLAVYSEQVTELQLPEYKEGQTVFPKRIIGSQHFTQPPARYSEATLIKALEALGIGRPSTYAPIIHTIQQRKYVEKEGRYFSPTDTGKVVTKLLAKYFPNVVDSGFTADMEDKLDHIANGDLEWVKMLGDFYSPFAKDLEKNEESIKRDEFTVLGDAPKDVKCPECGKKMQIKLGRYGRFYSCANFPDCKGMRGMDGQTEADIEKKPKTKEFQETYMPAPKTDDGEEYILKRGRFGEFWAHPNYPKVKDAQPLQLRPEKLKEKYGEIPETEDGRPYLIKNGRYGEFWAHPDYPEVKDIIRIKKSAS